MHLRWTEPQPPNEEVSYDHCIAETPFGRFLITWKGWKEHDCPTIDETPWGDWGGAYGTVDDAKEAAQRKWEAKLKEATA